MEEELAWAASVERLMDENGWIQERVARHLNVSRAAVSQALAASRLDPRIKEAMVAKAQTGWRARQEEVRRYAKLAVNSVLLELTTA